MDLPTGYSPPAYANTSDDRGGWAVIASSVGLVFVLLLASIRCYTRNRFRSRMLWEDAAIIGTVVSSPNQFDYLVFGTHRVAGIWIPLRRYVHVALERYIRCRWSICADALRERFALHHCYLLRPYRRVVSHTYFESRALAHTIHQILHRSQHAHIDRGCVHDRFRL
jgi:hypothetical protein